MSPHSHDHAHGSDDDHHDDPEDHGHHHGHGHGHDDHKNEKERRCNGGHDHSHGHGHGHDSHGDEKVTSRSATGGSGCSDHGHGHDSDATRRQAVLKKLYMATVLCFTFFVVEVVGGYLSGSLAILSDAAHLFADLTSFAVAIGASYLASLPATSQHTFGLKRTESLAALFSMMSLALVSVALFAEAVRKLWRQSMGTIGPEDIVDGPLMSLIATIGVVVNILLAMVLGVENHVHLPGADHGHSHEHEHGHGRGCGDGGDEEAPAVASETTSLIHAGELEPGTAHAEVGAESKLTMPEPERNVNLHAAYLHVLGDLAQSVAVLIAGLVIWVKPSWQMIDPICTLLFCAIVFYSTLGVLKSSIAVLLEEIPPTVSWQKVYDAIAAVPHVRNVHDLHVWSISHGVTALSVHVKVDPCAVNSMPHHEIADRALKAVHEVCKKFDIHHSTIQIQLSDGGCITCDGVTDENIVGFVPCGGGGETRNGET